MSIIELLQLEYFRTVAKHEHMTRAADELHIAQPSLSKTIARLEADLGVCLFERYGRQIRLNQYGKVFLRRVERMFLELEDGKRELLDLAGNKNLQVSIALNAFSMPEPFKEYLAAHSHVHFRQTIGTIAEMQQKLENGDIDFSISVPPIQGQNIECIPLITKEIFLIVPQEHRLAGCQSIDLKEVADESFISLKEGYGIRDLTEKYCRQAGFIPNIVFEGDIAASLVDLVNSGLGILMAPTFKGIDLPQKPVFLRIKEPICNLTIGLSLLRGHYLSQVAIELKDHIIDYFNKLQQA